jgi:hypothetical protein
MVYEAFQPVVSRLGNGTLNTLLDALNDAYSATPSVLAERCQIIESLIAAAEAEVMARGL